MIIRSVPEILKNESLFENCVREAANHVMKQPAHIRRAIAIYGNRMVTGERPGRETLVDFMRALCRANVQMWTGQLNDPAYLDDLDRLENTIARYVYVEHVAQGIDIDIVNKTDQ